jgi:capsular polysaccharide biosynthesis protein
MDDDGLADGWRSSPPRPKPWRVASAWNIPDVSPDNPDDPARPLAALVSFHYLRRAVRRRWLRCLLPAALGLLMAAGFLVLKPTVPAASTALFLAHDDRADPSSAMATDISLLGTHTVAERTVQALGLPISPGTLVGSLTATDTGSTQILQVTMTAPTEAEAVRRLEVLTAVYLQFRAKKVTAQTSVLIQGYDKRIRDLQSKVENLTSQIRTLSSRGVAGADAMSDVITERSSANTQLTGLRQLAEQAQLQQDSVVIASKAIEPPIPVSTGRLRRLVLVLASGLIAGLALGFMLVVLQAILSDRLWLRVEVASALDAPVPLSVRRIAPLPWFLRVCLFLPAVRRRRARRDVERQLMADTIVQRVRAANQRRSLAIVCMGNSQEARFGVLAAGVALQRTGRPALIVDLTSTGGVAPALGRLVDTASVDRPEVFRPDVVPSLTRGPADLEAADWDHVALAKARNAFTLVLADLDPAVGVDHLHAWTDDVIVAITAGASSVELVRTAGETIRSSGLRLHAAVLLRAPRDDCSWGGTSRDEGTDGSSLVQPRHEKGAVERSALS